MRVTFVGKGKKAVDRNRVRRRLREAFRIYYYSQWRDKPVDFVFMSNEKLLEESFEDLVEMMGKVLGEVKLDGVKTKVKLSSLVVSGLDKILLFIRDIFLLFFPCCRFEPSCSEYARQALCKYGPWKGGLWLFEGFCAVTPTLQAVMTR